MAIPESQLETWSHPGPTVSAQRTHESIRDALDVAPQLQGKVLTYLQGSYRNATNVRADSDVDVITRLKGAHIADISKLPAAQQMLYNSQHHNVTYGWPEFRADVLASLRHRYGANKVTDGNKAITVAAQPNPLAGDVVVALEHRLYRSYRGPNERDQDYISGIWFRHRTSGRDIINYPDRHYDNGVAKNSSARTAERYKPVVRMFKNARGCMVERGKLADGVAPSYFIQGLLYNVPDATFRGTLRDIYLGTLRWLLSTAKDTAKLDTFVCQNGIVPLFGNTPEQWDKVNALRFINALTVLWNEW